MRSAPHSSPDLDRELIALRGDVVRLQQTADRFAAMAHEAAEAAVRIGREIRSLEEMTGVKPGQRFEVEEDRLRGKAIAEVARRLLRRRPDPSEPIHYRDWYRMVTDAGHRISGRDPLATFLTQVSRLPDVERMGPKGVYRLRSAQPHLGADVRDHGAHDGAFDSAHHPVAGIAR